MGKSRPRVLALYTELTSLQNGQDESIMDYILCAKTAVAPLKSVGEPVIDSVLVTMLLKDIISANAA